MSDWYYADNGEQKGPVNESELKADFATNKLPADALVWKDGMDSWTPANQVPAFSFRPPPSPAKVQPPVAVATGSLASPSLSTASTPTRVVSAPGVNNPESVTPVDLASVVGTPEALEVDPADAEKNKFMGILAYLGILFLVPLLLAKDSPFAKYHTNQGLVVFLLWIATVIVVRIVDGLMGMIGLYALDWLFGLLYLVPIGLIIMGIINAANGKCVPLPLVGGVKLIK